VGFLGGDFSLAVSPTLNGFVAHKPPCTIMTAAVPTAATAVACRPKGGRRYFFLHKKRAVVSGGGLIVEVGYYRDKDNQLKLNLFSVCCFCV